MGSHDPNPHRTALEDAHEASTSGDGNKEIKYPFAFKNLDWDEYHRYRPRYPDSMLKMWLSYHQEHSGKFECLHDVGAGPGTLSIRIGHLFDRVVVSDAGQANIVAAEKNLKPFAPPGQPHKFTFLHSPAEQLRAAVAPSSVDLACVGMAFHYFEAPAAIRALAATLRPGGTLAAATYGFRLRFPGRPGLARLWRRAAGSAALHLLRARRLFPAAVRGLAAAMAGLDAVPLPTELFEPGALRILVNGGGEEGEDEEEHPLCFVDEDRSCWEPAPVRLGATDVCRVVVDENWRRVADVDWLRRFLAGTQMGFGRETWESAEWRQLEEVVRAAPGGQVLVEWPVAMILATRNDKPA